MESRGKVGAWGNNKFNNRDFSKPDSEKLKATAWENEIVNMADGSTMTGKEYEAKFGYPRRKYCVHEGKSYLEAEYRKISPLKYRRILIGRPTCGLEVVTQKADGRITRDIESKVVYV